MRILDHFDLLAPIYEKLISPPDAGRLIELADLPVDGFLLDAGGGTGRVSKVLAEKVSSVVVADLSSRMLQEAAQKNGLSTTCTKTETLPFSDASFERIIMVDALHHVYDQRSTILELWRVVKPGGRIVIEEPDVRTLGVKMVALMEKLALMRSRFLSPESIADLFYYPNAQKFIKREGITAWIIVDKA